MKKIKIDKYIFVFALVAVIAIMALPVLAHETKSARRLESTLAGISTQLSRISSKLRNLTGQIEELEQIAKSNQKNMTANQADSRESIKSIDRDIMRLKLVVKRLAQKSSLARRKSGLSKSNKNNRLDLSKKTPDELYNYAIEQLVAKRDYTGSQKAFELFVRQYPDNDKAGQALYWLGESLYVRGKFRDSASAYLRCYNSYPSSSKAADCLLRLGTALAALHEWDEACAAFDQLRANFPTTSTRILQKLQSEYERIQCNSDNPRG